MLPLPPNDSTTQLTHQTIEHFHDAFNRHDVDQIMAVLQSNLTTVKISGTVEQPHTESATFSDIGEGFKVFMKGEVDESGR